MALFPPILGTFQTFESEANLLRKISGHKCVISPPVVQILNFSDESLRRFYSSISRQKQMLLQQLFMSGGCTEAYVYPLYGVTMATRIKVGHMCISVARLCVGAVASHKRAKNGWLE